MLEKRAPKTYILPPGQDYYLSMPSTPPTPPTKTVWSVLMVQETLYTLPNRDEKIAVVQEWITTLVRKELGHALEEEDKEHRFNLWAHGIDFEQAELITNALVRKAEHELAAFRAKQNKERERDRDKEKD